MKKKKPEPRRGEIIVFKLSPLRGSGCGPFDFYNTFMPSAFSLFIPFMPSAFSLFIPFMPSAFSLFISFLFKAFSLFISFLFKALLFSQKKIFQMTIL